MPGRLDIDSREQPAGRKVEKMLCITYWEGKTRAMIYAECIAKENEKSIRFFLASGKTLTIRRNDIISIETEV